MIVRSEWDVADCLRTGELLRILPDWRLSAADVLILLRSRAGRTAKIGRFVDCLREDLEPVPWRS